MSKSDDRPVETRQTLNSGDAQWVKARARRLYDLPEPGTEWTIRDVPDEVAEHSVRALNAHSAILTVGTKRIDEQYLTIWETNPAAYEIIAEHRAAAEASETILPCDCSTDAIHNPRDVAGVKCKLCGEVFDREEVDLR